MMINYSDLDRQFPNVDDYLSDIRELVLTGDFTLGKAVQVFEEAFAKMSGLNHAVGVSSGTDALALSLKACGVGPGDEVITTPNTFVATVGAIVMNGARPVFVDNNDEYTIDVNLIEAAISERTKAIVPVHLTGIPACMPDIMQIAQDNGLIVIEDAAQAILASIDGQPVGSWGETACFSLHPLKNLNVWGDAGVIATNSQQMAEKLRLLRNHGLASRDEVEVFGHNCRLDTLQALVANKMITQTPSITDKRIANAYYIDQGLYDLREWVVVPPRRAEIKQVFHTYVIQVANRDSLLKHLSANGIEAKVHYPIPLHLQKAASHLGYQRGDFPLCEEHCKTIITLPVHQHLTHEEADYMIQNIRDFYLR